MGGGSKKSGSTTVYYGKAAYIMGMGQLTLLHRMKVDDNVVWRNTSGLAISGYYVSIDTEVGTCRVYAGKWDQPQDALLSDHPAYRGQVLVVWTKLRLGSSADRLPSISIEGTFAPWDSSTAGLTSPVKVCRELATDSRIGLGMSASAFPQDSTLEADTIMFAPRIDDAKSASDIFEEYLDLIFAIPKWKNRAIEVVRRFDSPVWDDCVHITQDDILEWPEETTESSGEVCTELHLRYTNLFNDSSSDELEDDDSTEQETVTIWREAELPDLGGKKVSYDATDITSATYANDLAVSRGHYEAVPICTGKVNIFKAKGLLIEPGDPFLIDDIDGTTRRVWCTAQEIEYGKDKVELEYELDRTSAIHDSSQLAIYDPPTGTSYAPVDPAAVLVFEAPRPLNVSGSALCICCARGSDVISAFGIFVGWGGADYVGSDVSIHFSVYGTLQAAIAASGTSMILENVPRDADTLDSVSSAQAASDVLLAILGTSDSYEIVSVQTATINSSSQVTLSSCLRNRMGTTSQTWPVGTPVHVIGRSAIPVVTTNVYEPSTIINTAGNPTGGTEYSVKLPQVVGTRTQEVDDIDDTTCIVNGVYRRPLPPSNVTGGGTFTGSNDLTYTVTPQLWREEGYPDADFYETVTVVPVLVIDSVRHVLSARASGTVTLTATEMTSALGSSSTQSFVVEFFTYFEGRHSATSVSKTIQRVLTITLSSTIGTAASVYTGTSISE
jgi:hypothetical protein